ncbi:MAG: GNAT family N-acetyltransferase [Ignavibacteria bacterium]|nr:GNAT family N-acetyltransferase [Ignavibacteria bacterium]
MVRSEKIGIQITPYSDELVKLHEEFCIKVWPDKKRRRSEKYNRWKFRGKEKGDVNGLLIAVSEGKVIGQLGLIPVRLKYGKEIFDAQWACDLIVDPELRKKGIGNLLFEYGIKRNMVTLGNNPSPNAKALMLSKGFKHIRSAARMTFPLDPSDLLNWVLPSRLKFLSGISGKITMPYFNIKRKKYKSEKTEFEYCDTIATAPIISLCQTERDQAEILHDIEFLKWRVDGLENFSHRLETMKSGEKSYAVHSHFHPYYNVYDWNCTDEKLFNDMLSEIFTAAVKSGAKTIQIMANNPIEEKLLKEAGFIRSRNTETVIQSSPGKSIDSAEYFHFSYYDTDNNL